MPKAICGALLLGTLFNIPALGATHVCRPMPDSVKIDGILDDKGWQGLDTLRLMRNNDPAGGVPSAETKVLVGWSRTRLYVAFIADSRNIRNTVTKHDGPLYDEDVVELFLDPDGDGRNYFELEWNSLNTSLDYFFTGPMQGLDANWAPKGMQHAVKVRGTVNQPSDVDTGITLEVALPWEGFSAWSKKGLPPQAGDSLPANFYRIIYPAAGDPELISWSPTGAAAFHVPGKFGKLVFSSQPVTSLLLPAAPHPSGRAPGAGTARRIDGKLYKPAGPAASRGIPVFRVRVP